MEKTYQYGDSTISYIAKGNKDGETIVMLHPAFANNQIFTPQLEAFNEDYYLIAVDLIGHGQTDLSKGNVNMKDMPLIIDKILDVEGRKDAHLLGVSLGSLVVQAVADIFPHRTKTVTVVGGYSIHKDNEGILKAQSKEMGKWLFYLIFSLKKFKQHIIESSSYSDASKAVFEKALHKFKRRQLMSMNGMNVLMTKKDDPVTYPLLVVCGEKDLALATDFGRYWETIEPKARYVEIENAGHCANIDNPEDFNQVFRTFITS